MQSLQRKVDRKVKPKMLKGQLISGPQLVELAEAYTEALNKGGIPVIESAWQYVQSAQIEEAYKKALDYFKSKVDQEILQLFPSPEAQVKTQLKKLRDDAVSLFKKSTLGELANSKN